MRRDMSGIDPDRHIDFHNEGWESCTRAMETTLRSDEALPLFDKAAERFKDVTCTGLLNWGNVHVCIAHKHLDLAAAEGKGVDSVTKVRGLVEGFRGHVLSNAECLKDPRDHNKESRSSPPVPFDANR